MPHTPSAHITKQLSSKYVSVDGIKLHYLEAGEKDKEVVLLLHGFPTSSYLWRNIMPKIAETHRVIALDLPGYGKSDKPLSASYSLNFYSKLLSGLLAKLEVDTIHLGVHDLGGPVGILWAVRNSDKVKSLTFFNTLVYSNFSWGVLLFGFAIKMPLIKNWISSPTGIARAMRFGVQNKQRIDKELLAHYQSPFTTKEERQALLKTASNMSPKAFKEMEEKLPLFKIPTRIIYGENDRILPKVARTMKRIQQDLPQTELTALPNCGHFLQEDEPEKISALFNEFLNKHS